MVGTSATVAFRILRSARARCRAGTVRAIMGLRGIGGSICEVGKALSRARWGGVDPIKVGALSPSRQAMVRPRKGLWAPADGARPRNAQAIRFMIKAYSRDFDAIAHFT